MEILKVYYKNVELCFHKFSSIFSRRIYVEQGIKNIKSVFDVYFNVDNILMVLLWCLFGITRNNYMAKLY